MTKEISNRIPKEQMAELRALADLPDDQINTQDIPEQKDWNGAKRGLFFRATKKQLNLRLDADIIDWFRTHAQNGAGYQTSINNALRDYMVQHAHD